MRDPLVAVCTVTHNDAAEMPAYLQSLDRLLHDPLEVIVVDSGSSDETALQLREAAVSNTDLEVIELRENVGFANGMNRAIASSSARFVLSLNADALPAPDFICRLLARLESHPNLRVGAVTGRLQRFRDQDQPAVLDAAGMRLTPSWRHFDRGSSERDTGQFERPERVFGGTGAATLYYRPALEDVAVDGEYFLNEFHSFREDAELAFRLRERGWEVLYEPKAVAAHRRHNLPNRRQQMPALVNYHSLKNRYLMRAYHETGVSLAVTAIPALLRDLGILAYVLARERESLQAFAWLWRRRRAILERRRLIQSRRIASRRDMASWFLTSQRPL